MEDRPLSLRISSAVVLSLGLLGACSSGESTTASESSSEGTPERLFRRFLPFENRWRSAAELPSRPQRKPKVTLWEVTQYAPGTKPTDQQSMAAADLTTRCLRAAQEHGWEDYETGLADGYELIPKDHHHFGKREYLFDDSILDCDRPEFLMYYATPHGRQLTGFMFYAGAPRAHGPQIGGPLTVWHYHVWRHLVCLAGGMLPVGLAAKDGRCPEGHSPTHRSPEMLHVWFVDHPLGPYATSMQLPPKVLEEHLTRVNRQAEVH